MNTLTCVEPGLFAYGTAERPVATPGYAVVKIKRIGVCGTDIHAFDGTQPFFTYPRILGHELGCEFAEGDAEGFLPGEAVTIIPYYHCGHCIACRRGKTNCCQNLKVTGVHVDGGMSEYLSVPSYSLVHGAGLSLDALALVEPFCIAAHGVGRAAVEAGECVLVVGAGPIGLATMAVARLAGGKVIALDVNEKRLAFCREKLGVAAALDASDPELMEKLRGLTNGDMPTVVIDATGNGSAINNAFRFMAHSARYVLIGLQKGDVCLSHPEFHKREGTLMSSRNATRADFEYVIDCIKKGALDPDVFITHRLTFNKVKEEFSTLFKTGDVIKAVIRFEE